MDENGAMTSSKGLIMVAKQDKFKLGQKVLCLVILQMYASDEPKRREKSRKKIQKDPSEIQRKMTVNLVVFLRRFVAKRLSKIYPSHKILKLIRMGRMQR